MGKFFAKFDLYSWRGPFFLRSFKGVFSLLISEQIAKALSGEIHNMPSRDEAMQDLHDDLQDQLDYRRKNPSTDSQGFPPPFLLTTNEEGARNLSVVMEKASDELLFTISGKIVEQLRWIERSRREYAAKGVNDEDELPSYGRNRR